jgi:solute carrier family 25 phosphate transporter 23/24/25/41
MESPESQNARDARIEQLWQRLDPQKKGELDLNGLKKGLGRIDHRKYPHQTSSSRPSPNSSAALKNANDMLKDVVKAMDKNGDQVIQYEGMPYHLQCLVSIIL